MIVNLAYGEGKLAVELPNDRTTVIEPLDQPGVPDEKAAVLHALDHPIHAPALRASVKATDKTCIVFTDMTRATPNDRLIPWLLGYLAYVPRENILLLNATGSHRANTTEELARMLGKDVLAQYQVLNHDCHDVENLCFKGRSPLGTPIHLNRHLLEADHRIITGFIEPHFFAGFSGGPKGIMPGVAGLETIMGNHGPENICSPHASFGVTKGNPLWEEIRYIASQAGPSFLLNVTLNAARRITGVFAGDLIQAHQHGTEFVRKTAMRPVKAPFDIVVTTNSGYPLDLNLYQGVKGLAAAARIVKAGGTIILAAECRDGVPAGSPHETLLNSVRCPEQILTKLEDRNFRHPEQWQAQIQALIQRRARVLVHSSLSDATIRRALMEPCHDISQTVADLLGSRYPGGTVAVLPQGPLTVPYID